MYLRRLPGKCELTRVPSLLLSRPHSFLLSTNETKKQTNSGSTPSHTGVSDDIWKPGGSIDRADEPGDGASTNMSAGWSSAAPDAGSVAGAGGGSAAGWGADVSSAVHSESAGWGTDQAAAGAGGSHANSGVWNPESSSASGMGMDTDASVKHEDPYGVHSDMESTIEGGNDEQAAAWFMERVCVTLKSTQQSAVIREVQGGNVALVEIDGGGGSQKVRNGDVAMVVPAEHDTVLVTGGAEVGVEGELVCIDGTDAILKESNDNFKIVDFVHLVKISA